MRLTPTEKDRLLLFNAAQLARRRLERGLLLNVPEATAMIADAAIEAARDGARLMQAVDAARSVLRPDQILPGVSAIVTEVKFEAVFDDGTRLVVVRDPFRVLISETSPNNQSGVDDRPQNSFDDNPGSLVTASTSSVPIDSVLTVAVLNMSDVPVSVTSHFHFFEVNHRLSFPRAAAYGMRLAIPAGEALRFDPGAATDAPLTPIGGDRVAIGFAGLVDGALDDPEVRERALQRAQTQGFLGS
jgi:urease subunit gamma/beta